MKWGQHGSHNTDVCSNVKTNIALQLKYKKDLNKMKGTSHFHSLTSEDNLTLKNARKINKIISEVSLLFPADSQPTSVNPDRIFPQAQCSPACVYLRVQISRILCQFPRDMKPPNVHSCHRWHACPAPSQITSKVKQHHFQLMLPHPLFLAVTYSPLASLWKAHW